MESKAVGIGTAVDRDGYQDPAPARDRPPSDWRTLADTAQLLRRVPILRSAPRLALNALADRMTPFELAAGEVLYGPNDPADRFYVVASGHLVERLPGGEEECHYESGTSVGDATVLGADTYLATVTALVSTQLWSLTRSDLEALRDDGYRFTAAETRTTTVDRDTAARHGFSIEAVGLGRSVRSGDRILTDVTFSVAPGELVAIVGGSGAGKTTLLEALAGVARADASDRGSIRYNGKELVDNLETLRTAFGFVPQDDIIHKELTLETTLRYAARLRLPDPITAEQIGARVRETMEALDLSQRALVRVGALSGGQRRRASIGVELLTRPSVFFLDEPTSGLDPSTQAELMRLLRRLADSGSTVVMTTHAPENVGICDKVLFLTREGRLAFFGSPAQARDYFRVDEIAEVYERLADEATPSVWAQRFEDARDGLTRSGPTQGGLERVWVAGLATRQRVGWLRQWVALTRRNFEIILHNRLTMSILLGSPVMVVLMLTMLFRPGAFELAQPSPSVGVMIIYWISFGGFFFGVTYGLLQIVSEFSIFQRERLAGVGVGAYVLSKLVVLVPFLLLVDVALLGVLRAFDRLPAASWGVYTSLGITLLLDAIAALAIGLLASALVREPAQATLALPVICWPQVLFSGALIPVPVMAAVGEWMSYPMSNRWAFEGMGHGIDLDRLLGEGNSRLGPPLLQQYGSTFSHGVWVDWAILAGFTAVALVATWVVLARRTRAYERSGS